MTAPYYADEDVTLHLGDCLDVLAAMEDASVDAVVTDPPYGLEFMGKGWDTFKDVYGNPLRSTQDARATELGQQRGGADPFIGSGIRYAAGSPFQAWCEAWAGECLRVLKPGGWLLAFGGTRTWHRLVCGIEDAGFEVRDAVADLTGYDAAGLMWVYGSGFPKSLNVSAAIDKAAGAEREIVGAGRSGGGRQSMNDAPGNGRARDYLAGPYDVTAPATEDAARWEGWGTALKPGWEPIACARKPLGGTVNVMALVEVQLREQGVEGEIRWT